MTASITRRKAVIQAGRVALGALVAGLTPGMAEDLKTIEVAYAGSMTSIMEGPIKATAARQLNLDLRGRAQGASGLAQLIVGGSIRPDLFISVTPSPMQAVIAAGKADSAEPIARTEMVIAYSPKSRFAREFPQSDQAGAKPWWQVLEQPGLRFGRTDPVTDPQGRNIIFVMMLAARYYHQPDLAERVLGSTNNPRQIFTEPTVEARLQSGQLDAASAYKVQPGPFDLPYLSLPSAINLSDRPSEGNTVTLPLNGRTYTPEPLVYYAAALKDAPHPNEAAALLQWLTGEQAKEIFLQHNYGLSSGAAPLRA